MPERPICRIGGVPEHYNAPWQTALQAFEDPEVSFTWENVPQGTGAMLEALVADQLDVAIVLTEGAVARAANKGDVSIIGTFVSSPLPWGVHAHGETRDLSIDFENSVFGISRFGSGSHLMAQVLAGKAHKPSFKVVDTMAGAAEAMKKKEIDYFLWDVATADCFARAGVWKCVGTVAGDWPAFVLVVRQSTTEFMLEAIGRILNQVRNHAILLKEEPEFAVQFLCDKYRITEPQAKAFMETVSWPAAPNVSRSALQRVVDSLQQVGAIDTAFSDVNSLATCDYLS